MVIAYERAMLEVARKEAYGRLMSLLRAKGRVKFSVISRDIVRDEEMRKWVIGTLITENLAEIRIEATAGRSATWLVLVESA